MQPDPDISHLPAGLFALFGLLLIGRHSVVSHDVAVQVADQDHGDHRREEQDNQQGVHDGEPVHLSAGRREKRDATMSTTPPGNRNECK